MSFPKYPKYKDSGVEWLGEVPEHWAAGRLRYITDLIVDGTHHSPASTFEGERLYITAKNIKEHGFDFSDITYVSEVDHREIFPRCPVKKSDVLYIKDGATAGIAMVNPLDVEFSMLSSVALIRPTPSRLDPRFVAYHLNAGQFKSNALNQLVGGAMTRFTLDMISRFIFSIPPLPEQTAIASFLDAETSKIDSLIAEQRRLIELLKEKRQAVISHAVTKGLNPDASMKASGIEWLGDVPEHWEVTRLGFHCNRIGSGKTPLGGAETYTDEGILFIRSQNVYDEGLFLDDVVFISHQVDAEMHVSRVQPGDILLNITGASLGRTCLVPVDISAANVNQHVCIIRLRDVALREFVALTLKAPFMKTQFDAVQNGAAREGLNFQQISKLFFAIPPEDERKQLAEYLTHASERFNCLTTEATRAIDLLQERRTAMISAAVTGKIDVREFAKLEAA